MSSSQYCMASSAECDTKYRSVKRDVVKPTDIVRTSKQVAAAEGAHKQLIHTAVLSRHTI
jgi:hypothetical protein